MEDIFISIILFILSVVTLLVVLPSSEVINNFKLKNALKSSVFNYYRNIYQELKTSRLSNTTYHLLLGLGLLFIGFTIFEDNKTILISLLATMSIVTCLKDIMIGEEFLKKEKVINQFIQGMLLLTSFIIVSRANQLLFTIPLLNLIVLRLINYSKNKYNFELVPAQTFIDKTVYYLAVYSQNIIIVKQYNNNELMMSVVLSSIMSIVEIYILEILTMSPFAKRKSNQKKEGMTVKISVIIILMLVAKIWDIV